MLCQLVFAQEPPAGWRRTTAVESSEEWRRKSPTRFLAVRSDFDGDGKPDDAELLLNTSSNQVGLFVYLTSTGKWQSIGEPFDLKSLDRFGIDRVKPGRYKTACGKGYGDYACAHGEPDFLKLSNPAIDFFYTESSDSIFYWDPRTKAFREILMSD
jgi:hypothetical protein